MLTSRDVRRRIPFSPNSLRTDSGAPVSTPPIECQIQEVDGSLCISLVGMLDQQGFMILSQALLNNTLDRPLKIDLKQVQYADRSGIRALVLLQRQARQAGVEFTLLNPSPSVERVLRTTGLVRIFNIETTDPKNPCDRS